MIHADGHTLARTLAALSEARCTSTARHTVPHGALRAAPSPNPVGFSGSPDPGPPVARQLDGARPPGALPEPVLPADMAGVPATLCMQACKLMCKFLHTGHSHWATLCKVIYRQWTYWQCSLACAPATECMCTCSERIHSDDRFRQVSRTGFTLIQIPQISYHEDLFISARV